MLLLLFKASLVLSMTFAVYSSPSSIRTPSRSIASSHNWETNRCFYNEIDVILCTNISFCSFVKIPWKCKIVNKAKKEFTIVFFDLTYPRFRLFNKFQYPNSNPVGIKSKGTSDSKRFEDCHFINKTGNVKLLNRRKYKLYSDWFMVR